MKFVALTVFTELFSECKMRCLMFKPANQCQVSCRQCRQHRQCGQISRRQCRQVSCHQCRQCQQSGESVAQYQTSHNTPNPELTHSHRFSARVTSTLCGFPNQVMLRRQAAVQNSYGKVQEVASGLSVRFLKGALTASRLSPAGRPGWTCHCHWSRPAVR